jgi:hypothetical protein
MTQNTTKTIRECDIIEGIKRGIADAASSKAYDPAPQDRRVARGTDRLVDLERDELRLNRRGIPSGVQI